MASTSLALDWRLWDRFRQFLESTLPTTADSPLPLETAALFEDITSAESAALLQPRSGRKQLDVAFVSGRQRRSAIIPSEYDWDHAQSIRALADVGLISPGTDVDYAIELPGSGGVLLFRSTASAEELRFAEEIAASVVHVLERPSPSERTDATTAVAATPAEAQTDRNRKRAAPLDPHVIRPDDDRMESLAQFAAGAGHEINNPVASITGRVELLLRSESDPERRAQLTSIGGQAYRIRDMISDTMLFARPPQPECESVSVDTILHEAVQQMEQNPANANVRFAVDVQKMDAWADRNQIRIVVDDLLRNSVEAMQRRGEVSVRTRNGSTDDMASFEISDSGPGLSAEERQHLFDPFYSGRQAGRGLGFGLPRCWRILHGQGGSIECHAESGSPVTMTVRLPTRRTNHRA